MHTHTAGILVILIILPSLHFLCASPPLPLLCVCELSTQRKRARCMRNVIVALHMSPHTHGTRAISGWSVKCGYVCGCGLFLSFHTRAFETLRHAPRAAARTRTLTHLLQDTRLFRTHARHARHGTCKDESLCGKRSRVVHILQARAMVLDCYRSVKESHWRGQGKKEAVVHGRMADQKRLLQLGAHGPVMGWLPFI